MKSANKKKLLVSICTFHFSFFNLHFSYLLTKPVRYRFPVKSGTVNEMWDPSFFLRVLVSGLLTASALSWLRWGLRPEQFGGPAPPDPAEPPPLAVGLVDAQPVRWPLLALFAMLFWVGTMISSQIMEDTAPLWKSAVTQSAENTESKAPTALNPDILWGNMILGCSVFIGLGLLLFGSGRLPPERLGIHSHDWPDQVAWGHQAFLAAILPTFLLLLATIWFRSKETEHVFLQLIREAPERVPLSMMFFTAAVVAPLSEELVFRVTLQGWLSDYWHPRPAIWTTAIIFAFVHGWRDGIALLPLSLILGYLYHSRRSYLAVVTAHGLFNATNMLLAVMSAMSPPS